MNFQPLQDRVLVERLEQENTTKSGIIIPDTAKEKPMQGKVIAIGKGVKDNKGIVQAPDVKIGDIVLFAKWGGTEVKLEGKEYIIMKESDILGTIQQ